MKGIVLNPDKLDVEYDKEKDVVYISAGRPTTVSSPKKASSYESEKGSLLASR